MKINLIKFLILLIATTMVFSSCQKDNKEESLTTSDKGTVRLKIGGTSFSGKKNDATLQSSNNKKSTKESLLVQHQEVSFNKDYNVTATLTAVGNTEPSLRGSNRAESVPNGPVTEPLQKGTEYTITVYEKGNRDKEVASKKYVHGVDDTSIEFELTPGDYTFTANATKKYYQKRFNDNFQEYQEVSTWTYPHWHEDISVTAGRNLNLNIVFTNTFPELTITLNAGNIGNITSIKHGTFYPSYSSYDTKIDKFNGTVTYGGGFYNNAMFTFPYQYTFPRVETSSTWTSNPVPLPLNYTDQGRIELTNVIINNIMGEVKLANLVIEEGVKYDLQLTLGDKKADKTYKVGNLEFAKANLVYDRSTNKYFFGSAGNAGDLFFPNYVRSLNINPAWPQPSGNENGAFGDPCKLMTPLNTWRLPKQTEIQESLFQTYGITPPSQPNQNTYSNGSSIYFGIRQYPGSELSNYFSLNFRGYGKDTGYYGFETDKGRYLLTKPDGGYTQLVISGTNGSVGTFEFLEFKNNENIAISVRCVKN